MGKVNSLAELKSMRQETRTKLQKRSLAGGAESLVQVKVAMATCGLAAGARSVMDFFTDELEKRGISASVTQTGCMGYCYAEPTAEVTLPGCDPVVYGYVDQKRANEIIEKYIKAGELVEGIIPVNYEKVQD